MSTNKHTQHLICIRHGESVYNEKNLFTGTYDAPLTTKGVNEAIVAAKLCKNFKIDFAYSSVLQRAVHTLDTIMQSYGNIQNQSCAALNERDYGKLTGLNKKHASAIYGEETVKKWRRSYHEKPPEGESLSETYQRVSRFYQNQIMQKLGSKETQDILIVAHGNSLRALTGHLLKATEEEFRKIEIAWCTPWIFKFEDGALTRIKVLNNPSVIGKNQTHHQIKIPVMHES